MRAEFRLSVMAGSSNPGFALSASVGKRSNATIFSTILPWPSTEAPSGTPEVRSWVNSGRRNVRFRLGLQTHLVSFNAPPNAQLGLFTCLREPALRGREIDAAMRPPLRNQAD